MRGTQQRPRSFILQVLIVNLIGFRMALETEGIMEEWAWLRTQTSACGEKAYPGCVAARLLWAFLSFLLL